MEDNTPITFKEKLGNALITIRQMMASDRRILFAVIGISLLIVVFVVIVVFSFSPSDTSKLITAETPTTSSPLSQLKRPAGSAPQAAATLSLIVSNPQKTYKVGDTITLILLGDSGGIGIRGYDAGFKFDPLKVSFVREKNLLSSMQYIRRIRRNWVIITSTQPLTTNNTLRLSQTKLMEITFKATAPGNAYFPLSYIPDSFNDSNLITSSSNDILNNATGIVVAITE